jgi:hypothetical protein
MKHSKNPAENDDSSATNLNQNVTISFV